MCGDVIFFFFFLPDPLCPTRSEASEWHCRFSAAAAGASRLWADRPPLCRRSLIGTRQDGGRGGGESEEGRITQTKRPIECTRVHCGAINRAGKELGLGGGGLTYGVRRERVILQILVPLVELLLHSVHEGLLRGGRRPRG